MAAKIVPMCETLRVVNVNRAEDAVDNVSRDIYIYIYVYVILTVILIIILLLLLLLLTIIMIMQPKPVNHLVRERILKST